MSRRFKLRDIPSDSEEDAATASYVIDRRGFLKSSFNAAAGLVTLAAGGVAFAATLMGTSEMFQLLEAGCDEQFVDYLGREDHTEDEAAAFREFLFGTTTEQLARLEEKMRQDGRKVISADAATHSAKLHDACRRDGDPAVALFEFFLYRHLQAAARRQAELPGPKRTAEEYVMIHYLQHAVDAERLSLPPE